MDHQALQALLESLVERWEGEVVEFKRAGNDYSSDKIGRYFSALANEANLRNQDRAWLVFGVDNRTRWVADGGTDYRPQPERLHNLKMEVSDSTEPSVTLREIHELKLDEGRVLLFEIPAAPLGLPIAWKGHYTPAPGRA